MVLGLSVHGSRLFGSRFTVVRFTVHGCSVYCYCHFAAAMSFRAESRNRQKLIITSFSTPLELTDWAWIGWGTHSFTNYHILTFYV